MDASYLAVARFRKPHGLKGEALVYPLTDEPDEVFIAGRVLVPVDEDGRPIGKEFVLTNARRHQRCWLLAFEGVTERAELEGWTSLTLGVSAEQLRPPADGEMYLHEIPGASVVEDGTEIGIARELFGVPGSQILVVEREGKDHLVPFRAPIVKRLDRDKHRIEVDLPPGLLEV